MFLDLQSPGPLPEPWRPNPRPRLTPSRERMVRRLIALNLGLLLVGPLAGASILEAVIYLLRR